MSKRENSVEGQQTEAEILQEHPGGLARALLDLREAPGSRLRRRVAAIPRRKPAGAWFGTGFRRGFAAAMVVVLVAVAILFAVPQWRAAAAQTLAEWWRGLGFGMSTDPAGAVTFRPAPPFDVYQPAELPPGYALKTELYQQAEGGLVVEGEVTTRDGTDLPSSLPAERMELYKVDKPHIILLYQGEDEEYLLLFERAAQPGEALPEGEPQRVAQWPAVMEQDGNVRMITWVAGTTWLTWEATVSGDDLLQMANSLIRTQTAEEAEPIASEAASEPPDMGQYPYCNPADAGAVLPEQPAATGDGQRFGTVRIFFADSDANPERVSSGMSVAEPNIIPFTRDELLQRAIDALKNPDLVMEPLPLPGIVMLSPEEECLRRVPPAQEEDYIVIEVVDDEAFVGFGGRGDRYVERAIKALERELARQP